MSTFVNKTLEIRQRGKYVEPAAGSKSAAVEVEAQLDKLRPAMEADGGGVELAAVEDGVIKVRLKGTCLACPSASLTMKLGIEHTLKARFSWLKEVVRVA